MRCSSCENLLDRYVEATLPPAQMQAVSAHLVTCLECGELHERLRVVDGLLETQRDLELPVNFTFAVMAEVRALPAPQAARKPVMLFLFAYLVGAWLAAAAAYALLRPSAPTARVLGPLAGGALQAVGHVAHALWPVTPIAVSAVVTALTFDVLLLAAIVLFYRVVRPALAERLASAPRERR